MALRLPVIGILLGLLMVFHPAVVFAVEYGEDFGGMEFSLEDELLAIGFFDDIGDMDLLEPVEGGEDEKEHEVEQVRTRVPIIQPLDDETESIEVDFRTPQQTFVNYFNTAAEWIIEVAVGIVTLWVLICGGAIVIVGGDAGKRAPWIGRMMTAILGLIVLIFFGVIMRLLNAAFFT